MQCGLAERDGAKRPGPVAKRRKRDQPSRSAARDKWKIAGQVRHDVLSGPFEQK